LLEIPNCATTIKISITKVGGREFSKGWKLKMVGGASGTTSKIDFIKVETIFVCGQVAFFGPVELTLQGDVIKPWNFL